MTFAYPRLHHRCNYRVTQGGIGNTTSIAQWLWMKESKMPALLTWSYFSLLRRKPYKVNYYYSMNNFKQLCSKSTNGHPLRIQKEPATSNESWRELGAKRDIDKNVMCQLVKRVWWFWEGGKSLTLPPPSPVTLLECGLIRENLLWIFLRSQGGEERERGLQPQYCFQTL